VQAMQDIEIGGEVTVNYQWNADNEKETTICFCKSNQCQFYIEHNLSTKLQTFLGKCTTVNPKDFLDFTSQSKFKKFFKNLISKEWNNETINQEARKQALEQVRTMNKYSQLFNQIMLSFVFEALYWHYKNNECSILGKGNKNSTMCSYCKDMYQAAAETTTDDEQNIIRGLKDIYQKAFFYVLLQKSFGEAKFLHTPGLLNVSKMFVKSLFTSILAKREDFASMTAKDKIAVLVDCMRCNEKSNTPEAIKMRAVLVKLKVLYKSVQSAK
jgi:hypothetical protein